jgi:ABC-2 type transport system permease protein
MHKIKTIIRKEWAEVFKNRMVLFTVIFLPLMLTALPLIILFTTRDAGMDAISTELPVQFSKFCNEELTGGQCFQYYLVSQFLLMFMMIPLIIPINIAAYSIVGEKTTRSLEPLLATPITTAELLTAKNLAATIPAVLATWAGFALFAVGAMIISGSKALASALLDPMWLLAVFLVGPLMAVLSVNFSIMVSSRVNDPRVAEQVSTVVILPLLALFFGQISGLFFLNSNLILLIGLALIVIDVVLVFVAVRMFQREVILTRWK